MKFMKLNQHHHRKASALILVLWASALMMVTVIGVAELVNSGLEENVSKNRQFRARLLAQSGVAVGMHPDVNPGDSVLSQVVAKGPVEKFSATISSETGRVNINQLLGKILTSQKPNEPKKEMLLLIKSWGVETEDAAAILDCMLDWIDADSNHRLNGAENDWYTEHGHPEFPPNRAFKTLDEIRYVKGMDKVTKTNSKWQDSITLFGDGKLSINFASADLIQIAAGVNSYQAQAVVRYRNGSDGKPFTKDDLTFTNMTDVLKVMGLPQQSQTDLNRLSESLSLEDKIWRIESVGAVGDYQKKITLIADRKATPPQIFEWQEQ